MRGWVVQLPMLLDALAFPLRRDNAIFLVIGTVLCSIPPVVASLLPGLSYVGIIGWIVEALITCYMLVYFHSVMEAGTKGEDRLPMWPEETDWQALVGHAFQVIVPLAISFLPLIGFVLWRVFATGQWALDGAMLWAGAALFAFGFAYLPIALLVYSFYGETAVLNVVAAARSIARIGREYFLVVALLAGLFGAYAVLGAHVASLPAAFAVPLASLLFFYGMVAAMRAVGVLYARHRERLGWE